MKTKEIDYLKGQLDLQVLRRATEYVKKKEEKVVIPFVAPEEG